MTIARAFTNSFAGIAPGSILGFVLAQPIGAALIVALYPAAHPEAPAPRDVNTGPDAANLGQDAHALPAAKPRPLARPHRFSPPGQGP